MNRPLHCDVYIRRSRDLKMRGTLVPKKTIRRKKKSKPKKFEPIPSGFHTVTPYLAIKGAAQAIEWYKKAFGAKELVRQEGPEGKLMHARLRIGDSVVMMSDVSQVHHIRILSNWAP